MAIFNPSSGEVYTTPDTEEHLRAALSAGLANVENVEAGLQTQIDDQDARLDALEAGGGVHTATFPATTAKGAPVLINSSSQAVKGQADASSTATIAGLAAEDVTAGNTGDVQTGGKLEQADWSAATGSALLTPGAFYYLSAATSGIMTSTPPSTSGQVAKLLGQALSTTVFKIEIGQAFYL